jgi:hypothetical protein
LNKCVIINGFPSSGKDTVVKQCEVLRENVSNMSTVDYVKSVAKNCGWDGKKDDRGRRFLSDLKDAMTRYDDIPAKNIIENLKMLDGYIVFIHCREPSEIASLKEMLGATTLFIKNDNVQKIETNHADSEVEDYNYDYILDNSGSLGDLIMEADKFLRWLDVNYGEV